MMKLGTKTLEEMTAEIEYVKKKIRQFENRVRLLGLSGIVISNCPNSKSGLIFI